MGHDKTGAEGLSRRGFLGALGAGAIASSCTRQGSIAGEEVQAALSALREDRFGRIFHDLPPFAQPSPQLTEALTELGKPGGIMDAKDPLERGPVLLITDPALSVNNPDNTTQTAGTTFFGQFVDHDVTFDLTPAPSHGAGVNPRQDFVVGRRYCDGASGALRCAASSARFFALCSPGMR